MDILWCVSSHSIADNTIRRIHHPTQAWATIWSVQELYLMVYISLFWKADFIQKCLTEHYTYIIRMWVFGKGKENNYDQN